MKERISRLTESKEIFLSYVNRFYKEKVFLGPSVYFHRKVIQLIRCHENYGELLQSDLFLEYIYATLASWGMHRMGPKGAKMRYYDEFRQTILSNKSLLIELAKLRLHTLDDTSKEVIKEKLSSIFKNLRVMQSEARLVGNSKVLHHLLPDLVPPIDKEYTVRFFYGTPKSSPQVRQEKEVGMFLEIFDGFHIICNKLGLTEDDYHDGREFTTSIPKLIDNAIVGFVLTEWKIRE